MSHRRVVSAATPWTQQNQTVLMKWLVRLKTLCVVFLVLVSERMIFILKPISMLTNMKILRFAQLKIALYSWR